MTLDLASPIATFSIVGFDPANGDLGVAVQSKFPNVRPVVPWAEAGVGAIATQAFANVGYGTRGLELLRNGATAEEALRRLIADDDGREKRQAGVVDAQGNAASWTGAECIDWAGGFAGEALGGQGQLVTGRGFAVQGNILVSQATVDALARGFTAARAPLADRLVKALVAGGAAGGDRRGEQSAALVVKRAGGNYDGTTDDYIDISIYDHPHPLQELERLYRLHQLYFFRSDPADLIPISPAICRELQMIMRDTAYRGVEFYGGPASGLFDDATRQALRDFMGWENYDVRLRDDDLIDRRVLEDIQRNYARWSKGRA